MSATDSQTPVRSRKKKRLRFGCALVTTTMLLAFGIPLSKFLEHGESDWFNDVHIRALSIAFSKYADNHGDKLPSADKWMDAIAPYVKDKGMFHNPYSSDKDYGYAMNADLSGKKIERYSEKSTSILIYETKRHGRNLSEPLARIPSDLLERIQTKICDTDGECGHYSSSQIAAAAKDPDAFHVDD